MMDKTNLIWPKDPSPADALRTSIDEVQERVTKLESALESTEETMRVLKERIKQERGQMDALLLALLKISDRTNDG